MIYPAHNTKYSLPKAQPILLSFLFLRLLCFKIRADPIETNRSIGLKKDGSVHDQRPPSTSPRRMEDHVKQNPCNKDRISGLHDDILLQVLSRMDTKTAVATSILSRRWRYLYPLLPSFHLIGSGSQIFRRNRSSRYWVIDIKLKNKLLAFLNIFHAFANPQTHPNMTSLVVEFRNLGDDYEHLLTECIKIALTGKLQNLKVWNRGQCYMFPSQCLSDGLGDCLRSLAISNCFVTKPDRFGTFRSLQKLTLSRLSFRYSYQEINMGQQGFQMLLKSCSSLEILYIEYLTIFPLLIVDAPNQLKELTIKYCATGGINISHAPKLNKLECYAAMCARRRSKYCELYFSAVPCLKYIRLGFCFYHDHGKSNKLEMLARAAPHLETLILRSVNTVWTAEKCSNVSFPDLRHLVLVEVQSREICSCFWIRSLLESTPLLESLDININIKTGYCWDSPEPPSIIPHNNLKVLKLKGFGEELVELEMSLILFVLESTTRLERVVISSDASHGKQRLMNKKSKILKNLGIGTDSKPLIIFT